MLAGREQPVAVRRQKCRAPADRNRDAGTGRRRSRRRRGSGKNAAGLRSGRRRRPPPDAGTVVSGDGGHDVDPVRSARPGPAVRAGERQPGGTAPPDCGRADQPGGRPPAGARDRRRAPARRALRRTGPPARPGGAGVRAGDRPGRGTRPAGDHRPVDGGPGRAAGNPGHDARRRPRGAGRGARRPGRRRDQPADVRAHPRQHAAAARTGERRPRTRRAHRDRRRVAVDRSVGGGAPARRGHRRADRQAGTGRAGSPRARRLRRTRRCRHPRRADQPAGRAGGGVEEPAVDPAGRAARRRAGRAPALQRSDPRAAAAAAGPGRPAEARRRGRRHRSPAARRLDPDRDLAAGRVPADRAGRAHRRGPPSVRRARTPPRGTAVSRGPRRGSGRRRGRGAVADPLPHRAACRGRGRDGAGGRGADVRRPARRLGDRPGVQPLLGPAPDRRRARGAAGNPGGARRPGVAGRDRLPALRVRPALGAAAEVAGGDHAPRRPAGPQPAGRRAAAAVRGHGPGPARSLGRGRAAARRPGGRAGAVRADPVGPGVAGVVPVLRRPVRRAAGRGGDARRAVLRARGRHAVGLPAHPLVRRPGAGRACAAGSAPRRAGPGRAAPSPPSRCRRCSGRT